MDRAASFRGVDADWPGPRTVFPPPPPAHHHPPLQIPHSDPFHMKRDPFRPTTQARRGSFGPQARAWQIAQGNGVSGAHHRHHTLTPPPPHPLPPPSHSLPPPPPPPPPPHPSNGMTSMALPYDPSRRRSMSPRLPNQSQSPSAGAPSRIDTDLKEVHIEQSAPPLRFPRQMAPPSPPHLPSSASSLPGTAPPGPPTASPFAGVRDLASSSAHSRPSNGMSISSILGSGEDRAPHGSPNATSTTAATPKSMPPPSPGRARSSSMREHGVKGGREASPPRYFFGGPRATNPPFGHDHPLAEPRKDGPFESAQSQHGFRMFQQTPPEQRISVNGHGSPGRPSSQPIEHGPHRSMDDIVRREPPYEGRFATFRHFGEPQPTEARSEIIARQDNAPHQNGDGPTSNPIDRAPYHSPQLERQRSNTGPLNFRHSNFSTPMREDQSGLFRPAFPRDLDGHREPLDPARFPDLRREMPRSSPPLSDLVAAERVRLGFMDRPITFEEHQRLESVQREQGRKETDGSAHRALLNISPDLNRKGRNSPLPQAVQGAQPRHVGPGGDNPGIKTEFGRMFSGLGSGVGTATPTAGHSMNGVTTPSRMTPDRHVEGGDLVRTAVAEIENSRNGSRAGTRGGKRNGRHLKEEEERAATYGRETPDAQRATKRTKTTAAPHHHHHHIHPHHHHHHHHEPIDNGPSPFNMLRFPSNPLNPPAVNAAPTHHHHHHHTSHAHPGHHHHHAPKAPPPRKPALIIASDKLLEECRKKPRKHLGSVLYTSEVSAAPLADTPLDARVKYVSRMKPLPLFAGKENSTLTVRVPRSYLGTAGGPSQQSSIEHFQEICRHRNLWGSDVYTDDSDVVAAAVHSGWIKGDFGEYNNDLREVCGNESEQENGEQEVSILLEKRPRRPAKVPPGHDAHITVLLLPPLELYASTNHHHIRSREWNGLHDGMSYMVHKIEFVVEGAASRNIGRTAAERKERLKAEMAKREAAASLLMFAGVSNGAAPAAGGRGGGGTVSVGA